MAATAATLASCRGAVLVVSLPPSPDLVANSLVPTLQPVEFFFGHFFDIDQFILRSGDSAHDFAKTFPPFVVI